MDEICNVLKEYTELESNNIIDLFKEYSANTKDKTEVHSKLKNIKCTKLMPFDSNGLYASAMSYLECEYPKAESGRPFLPEEDSCNSLYGKSIQKDITTSKHLWSEATLKAKFDSHAKNYEKMNETQYIVEIEEEEKEISETKSTTRLTPSHLGSFVLSHSKKIMNNFIHVIDGFYRPEIYYTDTDSLYISSSNWEKLNEAGLVSENEYCKGKNDYGDGGIIFGLYLAPKVKYNIIITSGGVLKEKKTFKGYSNDKITVDDYIRLASGHDISNKFKEKWKKSFINGVIIPKDDDQQKKVFRSYLNLVKRKPPNSEGIMYPYSNKDEYSLDENYEFDDFDYLTIQEENEECLITQ
ncbi:hypothetical protein LOTGIDRAFT_154566 [Lottia gigantea]|uniref:DNA-directed DNA polymerase n=1 Tax=Lottia gigantea TaxID=225164 RepID=V4A1A8_LOTGI|nr:hypothetical protein LOTGIDRAFT_154566 [Lottia gigantea]ESO87076.1 hypothetical protein LOTGIDRAFT_154566 [Lottia gigantea]